MFSSPSVSICRSFICARVSFHPSPGSIMAPWFLPCSRAISRWSTVKLSAAGRPSRVLGFLLCFQAGIAYYVSRPVADQPRGVVSNACWVDAARDKVNPIPLLFLALQTPSSISVRLRKLAILGPLQYCSRTGVTAQHIQYHGT